MIERLLAQTVRLAVTILIGVHLLLLARVAIERHQLSVARAHFDTAAGIPFQSVAVGGGRVPPGTSTSGFALRFASEKCPYSRSDLLWKSLVGALRARNIPIVILLPSADQAFAPFSIIPVDAPQVAFVSPEWASRYPLTLTPTTIIFDSDHRVVWHREGVLTMSDVKSAERVLISATMR